MNENIVLKKVKTFIQEIDTLNIKYCHFKSNEHIDAAVSGDTDLDILFDYNHYDRIKELLLKHGFVKFNTVWFVSYPYVEDYIAIDEGKVIHIHAHFKLVLGESKVKSYILPWDEEILKNRVYMDEYGIYASNPIDEMLLLIVRTAFKLPNQSINYDKKRDVIDARREFEWLKNRVSKEDINNLAVVKFGKGIIHSTEKIYEVNINYENIKSFYDFAKSELDKFRRYSYIQSKIIKYSRRFVQILALVKKKFNIFQSIKNHRTPNGEGVVVAIMGADGSGKSTQVKMVKNILSKKMDVRYMYMGSGNGPASWHRDILKLIKNILMKNKNKNTHTVSKNKNKKPNKSILKIVFHVLYSLSLAFEKKSKLKKIRSYKNKGMIVLTDRYPQTQINGFNDGPLLSEYRFSKNIILRKIAKFEQIQYKYAEIVYPDIVIKLLTDPNVLHKRREGEMSYEQIVEKQEGIRKLSFDNCVKISEIDASLDIYAIRDIVLNEIGKCIRRRDD
jgi:thymidylate kinase